MIEFNVTDYGAVADWDPANPDAATDNVDAFQAAIAACKARAGGAGIMGRVVADGHFYFSKTLDVHASIILEGSGNNENTVGGNRCSPGTWLVFPPGSTGLRFWSTWSEPDVLSDEGVADQSVVRNLTISCKGDPRPSEQLGHGIQIHCPVNIENVCVENFGQHGIFIDTQEYGDPRYGNAGGTMLLGCRVAQNGGDGIRVKGSDCLCTVIGGAVAVNRGWGINDTGTQNNTYIGIIGNANWGYNPLDGYALCNYNTSDSPQGINASVFINCYSEGNFTLENNGNRVRWPATAIGGALSYPQQNLCITNDPVHAPFTLQPTGQISNRIKTYSINSSFLEFGTVTNEGHMLGLTDPSGWSGLKFEPDTGWWTFENVNSKWMQWPTTVTLHRHRVPLFPSGFFFGSAVAGNNASKSLVRHDIGDGLPQLETWEKGDIVWNRIPAIGEPIGWVCLEAGTNGTMIGITVTADIAGRADSFHKTEEFVNIMR
jgi:Pectate lyase superfamily protein